MVYPNESRTESIAERVKVERGEDKAHVRVLLAEDHPDTRSLVATALRLQGHEVVEVRDGVGLLYHALFGPRDVFEEPEVIISDVRLPDWSGLEILGLLRRVELKTPFVLITAYGDSKTKAEAERWGAAGVVPKPLDLDKLCVMVRALAHSA